MLSQLSQAHPNAASARPLPLLILSGKAPRGRGRLSEDGGIPVQSLKVLPPWASAPPSAPSLSPSLPGDMSTQAYSQ